MNSIPNYVLYGDKGGDLFPDYLHIESIRKRSVKHGWKFSPHQHHNLYQLFYISNGGGLAQVEDKTITLDKDSLLIIPPMTVHGFDFFPDTKGWVLTLPELYLQNILEDEPVYENYFASLNSTIHLPKAKSLVFNDLLTTISNEHSQNTLLRRCTLRGLVTLVITNAIKAFSDLSPVQTNTVSQRESILLDFKKLIDLQFKNRLTVAGYAEKLAITPTHLSRICNSVLGVPASELITARTILEAKRLLLYTSMSITEISYELGFLDPAHFTKFFCHKAKLKPTQFRKRP